MIYLLLSLFLAAPPADAPDAAPTVAIPTAKACYGYVVSDGPQDSGLTRYVTRVFSYRLPDYTDLCHQMQVGIENQYHDAFRARYGELPDRLSGTTVHTFENRGEAERHRRRNVGDLRSSSDDWTVHTFYDFSYYPED